jgi:predicted Zn-dependent protease
VTGRPTAPERWRGWYLDGLTPERRAAAIELHQRGLRITTEDGLGRVWWFSDLRQKRGFHPGQPIRLERRGDAADAVIVDDPRFALALHGISGARQAGVRPPRHPMSRGIAVAAVGAIALLLVGITYRCGLPAAAAALTALVPVRWEEQLGEQTFALITASNRVCTDPRLEAAIADITARLTAATTETAYRFRVAVVDIGDVNAVALPGGRIVVFRGLLEMTDSPEMLAGVLGHEFQHVIHRHTTRAMVRQAALSGLISAVTQDARWVAQGLGGASVVSALHHGRAAEEEADREGLRMLQAAGIDQEGMIAFFRKIAVDDEAADDRGGFWRFLATHPGTTSRIETLTALAARGPMTSRPLPLSAPWEQTRALCVRQ